MGRRSVAGVIELVIPSPRWLARRYRGQAILELESLAFRHEHYCHRTPDWPARGTLYHLMYIVIPGDVADVPEKIPLVRSLA
jgi:hypothetical protein